MVGDQWRCTSSAISGDGNTVVGSCNHGGEWDPIPVAWRGNESPEIFASSGYGTAVNYDGSILAFWNADTWVALTPSNVPIASSFVSTAHALSDDGSIVVGEPFIWTDST